jgi:hypothetical protein
VLRNPLHLRARARWFAILRHRLPNSARHLFSAAHCALKLRLAENKKVAHPKEADGLPAADFFVVESETPGKESRVHPSNHIAKNSVSQRVSSGGVTSACKYGETGFRTNQFHVIRASRPFAIGHQVCRQKCK